ncbi:MAG TPA: hypothetical protein VHW24_22625 [Bryobacteraceae bacterium]|nr:hypothetical protein [Bryobacteraceae bacterium]
MIKIPVSSQLPVPPWPRLGVDDYTFAVRSFGGQALGIDLKEFDWSLQVDSRAALVSVELSRSDADMPGTPIGLFRYPIADAQLHEFEALIADAKLGDIRPAMQGHPGYTERIYTFTKDGRSTHATINNSDEATNNTIAPLRTRINQMLGASFTKPERAVKAGITRSSDGFEISIENIGIEKVCFSDPRWIATDGPLHRATVLVSAFPETKPGDPPLVLDWHPVPLETLPHPPEHEPLITLDPHGVWKADVRWKFPGNRSLAFFTWANYKGQPMVDHVYRIRGRLDSPRLTVGK